MSSGRTKTVSKEKYHDINTTRMIIAFCLFQSPYLCNSAAEITNTTTISTRSENSRTMTSFEQKNKKCNKLMEKYGTSKKTKQTYELT